MEGNGGAPLVLLVEDSDTLRQYALAALRMGGYEVVTAVDGRQALAMYGERRPDVIVLDVDLPELSGWDVLESIRRNDPMTPVIMLTATAPDERSRVRGLVGGADDYVVKPVGPAELRARVAAHLRRARRTAAPPEDVYEDGLLRLDFRGRRATVGGRELALTPTEFKLLSALVRNAGQTLDRRALLEQVWGDYSGAGGEQVKVYVGYLRRKLAEATSEELIETVRGFGYRYRVSDGDRVGS